MNLSNKNIIISNRIQILTNKKMKTKIELYMN